MAYGRRVFVAGLGAAPFVVRAAAARSPYPTRPITLVVPFAPGGTADIVARILADKVGAALGQTMLVDNRSGADGIIGAQFAARARADGYTLLQLSTTHVIVPSLRNDLPYDWNRDFTPISGVAEVPEAVAVKSSSSIRSLDDLAEASKATAHGVAFSSGGTGSLSHLTSALLIQKLSGQATHVPYRGLSAAVEAVLSDQVQFTVANIPDVLELERSGRLRLLAVTSAQRLPYLPAVPTLVELGLADQIAASWTIIVAPVQTQPDTLGELRAAFDNAAADPAVQSQVARLGVAFRILPSPEVVQFMQGQALHWREVIGSAHIQATR